MSNRIRIGILGVGAIGSVVSYELSKCESNRLFYFARTRKSEIKIRFKETSFVLPIDCSEPSDFVELDWLFICLKEYHYTNAEESFQKLITESTNIAVIRNGINLKEKILNYTSAYKILECIIDCPVQQIEDGYFKQYSKPIVTTADNELANSLSNLFCKSDLDLRITKDFKSAAWKKLIESSALGSILCITSETCEIFRHKEFIKLYQVLVDEGVEVALADGAQIEKDFEKALYEKLMSYDSSKGSSMLTDRLNAKPIELNAKNGAICSVARQNKIETPMNDLMCELIGFLD